MIKMFEGFRAKPYKCPAGVPTIGYGSTFYSNGKKVTLKDKPITEQDATNLLTTVVTNFSSGVSKLLKIQVTQNQFDALVDFAYNVGIGNLKSSTLLKKVNAKNFSGAALEFIKWNKADGKVLPGLTKRRTAEKDLFIK
jgi:lysozyme